MKRYLFTLIVLLFILSSCIETSVTEENVPLAEGTFTLSLTANLPELPVFESDGEIAGTKAATQYTVRIKWAAGDKLSVVNLTTGKLLGGWLTANSSGLSTTFSGTLSGTVNSGDLIAYFYPAQEYDGEMDFPGLHVDMSNQKGTTGTVPLCVYSVVQAENNSFQNAQISFSFLMSYIMIGMSDIPASAQIKTVTLTNVTTQFDLAINSGRNGFSITPIQGNIILTPDSQKASESGVKTVYAAIPESVSTTRKVILETESNSFETVFTSAKLQNGYAYNTNVSGFLDDDLSFEDSRVRDYCLAHFDTNGNGKLSMVEIAGIKTFPEALPAGILCFNELEYFYGLTILPSFADQTNLTDVSIPRQIANIPDGAFSGCVSLLELHMNPINPPALGTNALAGTPTNMLIIVGEESVAAYQNADGWNAYSDQIVTTANISGSNVRINTEGGQMGSEIVDVIVN